MPMKKQRVGGGSPKGEGKASAKGTPAGTTKKDGSKNIAGTSGGKDGYR